MVSQFCKLCGIDLLFVTKENNPILFKKSYEDVRTFSSMFTVLMKCKFKKKIEKEGKRLDTIRGQKIPRTPLMCVLLCASVCFVFFYYWSVIQFNDVKF